MSRAQALAALILMTGAARAGAQVTPPPAMEHKPGMEHKAGTEKMAGMDKMAGMEKMEGMGQMGGMQMGGMPTRGGQAAFATIGEIVKMLEADTTTNWAKVDLEALRQHLIDMDNVTLRSRVAQSPVAGGIVMNVTGDAQVTPAIRRMLGAHAKMVDMMQLYHATTVEIPGGMRLTVTARDSSDTKAVTRIRGLGFIGLMTEGDHHNMHHMMIARGMGADAHKM